MIDRERYALIKTFTDTLLEYKDEIRTLKERCKALEEQLNKVQSSAIVYKDLFNEAKRVIGEDVLYTLMYNEDLDE